MAEIFLKRCGARKPCRVNNSISIIFLLLVLASGCSLAQEDAVLTPTNHQLDVKDSARIAGYYPWLTTWNPSKSVINTIGVPIGYSRVQASSASFAEWLRYLPVAEKNIVLLYNGQKKRNQSAQYKVLNIDVGKRDLQQCADAVMRLRAEYLKAVGKENEISFNFTSGDPCNWSQWKQGYRPKISGSKVSWSRSAAPSESYKIFRSYLNMVFTYAGTASLSKELKLVDRVNDIKPGDIFLHGGHPGHTVIVMDVARDREGNTIFMLAQSYMPAQQIHILKNPAKGNSPWYSIDDIHDDVLRTPEWTFRSGELKRF